MSNPSAPVQEAPARPSRAGAWVTIVSVWSWAVFGVACIAAFLLMCVVRVVTAPFDKGRYATGWIFRKVPVVQSALNPLWHFTVSGTLPDDPRHPYVMVANHESFADILLVSHLPWEMKWLSKKQMFRIPIAGWSMWLAGDIQLERGDRESAQKAMAQCAMWLRRRVSVMVFPEGTRSAEGQLAEFKAGAFRLAIEEQVPIVPMALVGTKEAIRKHDWRFGPARAEVHVMAPVDTTGMTLDDLDALRTTVRDRIASQLVSMRAAAAG